MQVSTGDINWRRGLIVALLPTLGYIALAEASFHLYLWGEANHSSLAQVFGALLATMFAAPGMLIADWLNVYEWPVHFGHTAWNRNGGSESSSERFNVALVSASVAIYVAAAVWSAVRSRSRP
jgi:hypothetical protein